MNSTVVDEPYYDLVIHAEPSWEDLPYNHQIWDEVEYDSVSVEYVAARESLNLACVKANTELKHSNIEEERKKIMIQQLDLLVAGYNGEIFKGGLQEVF